MKEFSFPYILRSLDADSLSSNTFYYIYYYLSSLGIQSPISTCLYIVGVGELEVVCMSSGEFYLENRVGRDGNVKQN